MSRRPRTTLYEALRTPAPGQPDPPLARGVARGAGRGGGPDSHAHQEGPRGLGAGAIATIAVAFVVLSAAAFLVGFSQGRASGFEEASGVARSIGGVQEPLRPPPLPTTHVDDAPTGGVESIPPRRQPAAGSDPRFPGLNYFVLAQVEPERAPQMVEFLREQGLEAFAQKWDNGRFLQVFVLPGFPGGDLKSAEAEALKKSILAAGRRWKSAAPGNEDFRSHYPRKYLGD